MVDEFEARLAARTGRKHAIAMSSGTAALHMALSSQGVGPGDLVATQGFSFIATANAVRHAGAEPLFIDSDPDSWVLSAEILRQLFKACKTSNGRLIHRPTGKRLAAVMPAPVFGLMAGMVDIETLCAEHDVPMIVDAAEALGASNNGRLAESFGIASCVSFNGNKVMTTGSGGAVLTDDAVLASRCRHLSTQAKTDTHDLCHDAVGHNFRMAAVNAAVGLGQLDALDDFLAAKERIAANYRAAFCDNPMIRCMPAPTGETERPWLFCITLPGREGGTAVRRLNADGIAARRLWRPLFMQEPYVSSPRQGTAPMVCQSLYAEGLSLPTSVTLNDEAQACVIKAVRATAGEAA